MSDESINIETINETKLDNVIIEKVKKLELDILKHVHRICIDNNLKYYLMGGTLLGAVRHKGFIPWDDDIDICMFREDYDKLREILQKEKNGKYFIQHYSTDTNYTRYITKIRINGTKFVEKKLKNLNIHHGIFIDIFPLDRIRKADSIGVKSRAFLARLLLKIYSIKSGNTITVSKYKTFIMSILRFPFYLIPKIILIKIVEWLYTMSNKSDSVFAVNFSSRYGYKKQTYPLETFGEGTILNFEGEVFIAPSEWEIILRRIYGEYMKFPPEDKRNSGHEVIQIDLGKYAEIEGD